jgi:hypothetical protein
MTDLELIETLRVELPSHYDDPNYLSKAIMDFARYTYYHNTLVADAELAEVSKAVKLMAPNEEGKKISVAEAEKRAVVDTKNVYGKLKLDQTSNETLINAIKLRVRVLLGEKDNSKLE